MLKHWEENKDSTERINATVKEKGAKIGLNTCSLMVSEVGGGLSKD